MKLLKAKEKIILPEINQNWKSLNEIANRLKCAIKITMSRLIGEDVGCVGDDALVDVTVIMVTIITRLCWGSPSSMMSCP